MVLTSKVDIKRGQQEEKIVGNTVPVWQHIVEMLAKKREFLSKVSFLNLLRF